MSEETRTPKRPFIEVRDVHHSGESASEREDNLQSQLLDSRMSSSEVHRRINAIFAPLATQLKTLILSVTELIEKNSSRLTEGNAASERSRSSGHVPTVSNKFFGKIEGFKTSKSFRPRSLLNLGLVPF